MFILVKYGNNETLLCNPSCAVINLLTNIKRRAGYGNSNVTVDLSDETGENSIISIFIFQIYFLIQINLRDWLFYDYVMKTNISFEMDFRKKFG